MKKNNTIKINGYQSHYQRYQAFVTRLFKKVTRYQAIVLPGNEILKISITYCFLSEIPLPGLVGNGFGNEINNYLKSMDVAW